MYHAGLHSGLVLVFILVIPNEIQESGTDAPEKPGEYENQKKET